MGLEGEWSPMCDQHVHERSSYPKFGINKDTICRMGHSLKLVRDNKCDTIFVFKTTILYIKDGLGPKCSGVSYKGEKDNRAIACNRRRSERGGYGEHHP